MEIKLDTRYDVTAEKADAMPDAKSDTVTEIKPEEKATEKPDENGWTQTQQKALEA